MRISRVPKKKFEPRKVYRVNEAIAAPKILVLDTDGSNLGVMTVPQGLALAREREMDLVEINPKNDPPVTKIIDFGQFRYTQEKEARLAKAHQHIVQVKGVRLSLRIGPHDLDIRKNQAIKFLNQGDKVKIEIILRGREFQYIKMAIALINNFISSVTSIVPVRLEQAVEKSGNKVTALIAKS